MNPHRLDAALSLLISHSGNVVTKNTASFFDILDLPKAFLDMPVEMWKADKDFKAAKRVVTALSVVNDTAERGVK
jgi:hypothetical protein